MTSLKTFTIGPDLIPVGYSAVVAGDPVDQLDALGRALVASPEWPPDVTATISADPGPVLLLTGRFSDEDDMQLATLLDELIHTRIRYVDYPEVETVAERLATALRSEIPDLDDWSFAAVPRGGLIVLGILSYLLDLAPSRIVALDAPVDSLVVIDDCSLSGARIQTALSSLKADRAAVGTLYSVPAIGAALRSRTELVTFVSGEDLADTAPARYGTEHERWLARWHQRGDYLWVGTTDHLVFPWNEPDIGLWNETEGRLKLAWRLIPPERCLKNRTFSAHEATLRHFVRAAGPIRQGQGVVDLPIGDELVVVDLAGSRTLTLTGTAAAMWISIMAEGTTAGAAAALAVAYEVDVVDLERDIDDFTDRLSGEGLISFGLRNDDQPS